MSTKISIIKKCCMACLNLPRAGWHQMKAGAYHKLDGLEEQELKWQRNAANVWTWGFLYCPAEPQPQAVNVVKICKKKKGFYFDHDHSILLFLRLFAVFVKTGGEETPAAFSGGKRYPAEQHPDLTQSALPQWYGRGMDTQPRRLSSWHNAQHWSPYLCFQVFEVTSTTRVRDLIQNIVKKLSLASAEGYSIFVKTHNKVCLHSVSIYFCKVSRFP